MILIHSSINRGYKPLLQARVFAKSVATCVNYNVSLINIGLMSRPLLISMMDCTNWKFVVRFTSL